MYKPGIVLGCNARAKVHARIYFTYSIQFISNYPRTLQAIENEQRVNKDLRRYSLLVVSLYFAGVPKSIN